MNPSQSKINNLLHSFVLCFFGFLSISSSYAVTVEVVLSPPGAKQSAMQGQAGYSTEDFGSFTVGAITTGSSVAGAYTATGGNTAIGNSTNPIFGGNFVGVNSGNSMTFTLPQPSRYVGMFAMWISNGSTYEFLDTNDNVVASLNSSSLMSLLNSGAVASDGQTYTLSQYIASGQSEPSVYINLRLNDPSITFNKIRLSASGGTGNEFDNITVSANYYDPTFSPAPIPTLGEWAMIFMASLMAMFGIRRMRRSK